MMSSTRFDNSPIYLVGFMGCGKSAVGAALAVQMGRPFVDLDREIELVVHRSIADLIAAEGETEFRRVESEVLGTASSLGPAVVATGGGVVLDPANRKLMNESGISVWLDAPFELCWDRIATDRTTRPLAPDRDSALARYTHRLDFYRQSTVRVESTGAIEADRLAAMIVELLGEMD